MKQKKKLIKNITSICGIVLAGVIIIFLLYSVICSINGKIAFIGGRAYIKIVSQSMEPKIPKDSYIAVKKLSQKQIENLKVGEVIVFYSHDAEIYGKLNTHRINRINVTKSGKEFVTKGDNNPVADSAMVNSDDIVALYKGNAGKITSVVKFFSGKYVFFLLVLVPAAALLVICVFDLAKKAREIKIDNLVNQEVERLKKENQDKDKNNNK